MPKITFTNTIGIPEEFAPKPASACVPEWYKNLDSYIDAKKHPIGIGGTSATVKRCMPLFDSIVAGYILFTPVDVYVSQRDGEPWFEWPSFNIIQFNPVHQAPTHPDRNDHKTLYPKWINPWSIKTEPGYSVLFVKPFHRESAFTIFPGIVDTDTYYSPVNFPFVLNDVNYEGLIPAGTPMVQVIPFKRESWKMEFGGTKEINEQKEVTTKLHTRFFDSYKRLFRQTKVYR